DRLEALRRTRAIAQRLGGRVVGAVLHRRQLPVAAAYRRRPRPGGGCRLRGSPRSEEHTSELQSRENLVCRLLLEKKNLLHGRGPERSSSVLFRAPPPPGSSPLSLHAALPISIGSKPCVGRGPSRSGSVAGSSVRSSTGGNCRSPPRTGAGRDPAAAAASAAARAAAPQRKPAKRCSPAIGGPKGWMVSARRPSASLRASVSSSSRTLRSSRW